MTKAQRVRRERNVLRADAIEGTDDAILRRVAQGIEYGIRWSTERTVGWPMPLEEAIELAKLIRAEVRSDA